MPNKLTLSLLLLVLLLSFSSALSQLTITLDSSGNANFADGTTTNNLTSKTGEIWSFSYSSQGNEIELILPKNSEILDVTADSILTQDNRITLLSNDKISVRYKVYQGSDNFFLYIASAIGVILILILSYYYYFIKLKPKVEKIEKKAKDKFAIIKKVLNERENIILNNLKKSGKIKMSHLRKTTDIPKASFSRHLQELEKKKLIRRTGEGKNKFVEIK